MSNTPEHQNTARPRTVGPVTRSAATGGGAAAALVTVAVWLLAEYGGVEVPSGVEAAVVTLVVFVGGLVGGYIPRPGDAGDE